MKNIFSFRLDTTSYIIPAGIIPNVEILADIVDDIELVLFESENISNLPETSAVTYLRTVADQYGTTFTIHFPLDINLCSCDKSVRQASVEQCRRIIELVEPLEPFAYIVHCNDNGIGRSVVLPDNIDSWQKAAAQSFAALCGEGIESCRFCVETLNYPFKYIEPVITDYDMSICLDIGHIIMNGFSLHDYCDRYLDRSRVIHLHGIIDGSDHKSIEEIERKSLDYLIKKLTENNHPHRVVTLEIFNEKDLVSSLDILRGYSL